MKNVGRDDYSLQSNAHIKNECRCACVPLLCRHGVDRDLTLFFFSFNGGVLNVGIITVLSW